MAESPDEILKRLFGVPDVSITPMQAGILGSGSLLATEYLRKNSIDNTLNNIFGIESNSKILNRATANVMGVSNELNNELANISNDAMASVKSHAAQVQDSIKSSATARGLDASVANESASQFGASTSGAYAAAHKALAEAQAKATANMSGSISSYQQSLAKQQLANKLQEAADNAGIISSITGIASAIMARANSMPEQQAQSNLDPYGTSTFKTRPTLEEMAPKEQPEQPMSRIALNRVSPFEQVGLNEIQQGRV